MDDICFQCGEHKQAIRKEKLLCGVGGSEEEIGEILNRHKFKNNKKNNPYIDKSTKSL